MKKCLSFIAVAFLPLFANAYDACIDGIYYNLSGDEAEVTYLSSSSTENKDAYSGSIIIPETITYDGMTYTVTSIGKHAFFYCSNLTSIVIPSSITYITLGYAYNNAFYCCNGLASIIVDTGNTTYDSRNNSNSIIRTATNTLVLGCKNTIIPNDIEKVGYCAFNGCKGLTSIDIPNSVTSIGELAFNDCSNLVSVNLPNSLISIERGAFEHCALTSVIIPSSVTSIGSYPYSGCNIEQLVVDENNPCYDSRNNCNAIIETATNTLIQGCKNTIIPNTVTTIGHAAFMGSIGLDATIYIPKSITKIEGFAFAENYDRHSLREMYIYAESVPEMESDIFWNTNVSRAILYVPGSAYEAYKSTSPWSDFGTIVALTLEKCATPTIVYADGKLKFSCETEDVEFISTITDDDIKSYNTDEVELSATYTISIYATKPGYTDSDVAIGTLCWIEQQPTTENIVDEDAVMEVKALPVFIQTQGGTITIQGAAEGTPITVYDLDGRLYGTTVSEKERATIATSLRPGSTAVVKIGERVVKVLVK